MHNHSWKTVLWAWSPVLLWIGVIALESFAGSTERTGRILLPILVFLFGHVPWRLFNLIHFAVRKFGHFFGYAVLSTLFFRAFRGTFPHPPVRVGRRSGTWLERTWRLRWALMAVVGTLAVASLDEWHQAFVPGRTGSWRDVFLDTIAGIFAQQLILTLSSFTQPAPKPPQA